jgi:hypothetical protein
MEKYPKNLRCVLQGVKTNHCPTTPSSSDFQETLYLLTVPGMRELIMESMAQAPDTCAKALDW